MVRTAESGGGGAGGIIKILWNHTGEWEKVTLELGVRG